MKKLFIVVNLDSFFLSHRKEIAVTAQKEGFDVTVIAMDTGRRKEILDLGLKFINLPINKAGTNLKEEFRTFWFLYQLYRREHPDIVHHVGVKIVLWGGIAAKLSHIHGVVNAISGLGILFSEEKKNSIITKAIIHAYRYSHHRTNLIDIFQNNEDKALFIRNKILNINQCIMTNGSGVDLTEYSYTPEHTQGKIKIIFAARMVEDKGILILIEAAKTLKKDYLNRIQFLLVGGLDTNPKGINAEYLHAISDGTYIQWLGYRTDVKQLLEGSHIVALPSWYREGIPRSLIEATAIGRPIITTNSIGCKETVIDNYNGYLIPIKNSTLLAEKLKILIDNPNMRKEFGRNSRIIAEQKFSIQDVVKIHLSVYKTLSNA